MLKNVYFIFLTRKLLESSFRKILCLQEKWAKLMLPWKTSSKSIPQHQLCWKSCKYMPEGKIPLWNSILKLNKFISCAFIVNFFAAYFFLLQTQNIQKICHKVVEVTEQECPELVPETVLTEAKYTQLFTLFGQCHFKFNSSSPMEEPELTALGKQLTSYMALFMKNKMFILRDL